MSNRLLVLGATETLGNPVARHLAERGHTVRVLARALREYGMVEHTVWIEDAQDALRRGNHESGETGQIRR